VNAFWAAIRFLTPLPLPASWGNSESSLAESVPWFPIVGALLGLVVAAAAYWLQPRVPMPLLCTLMVVLLIACSGGLHADGLSDTADGFFSSRPKEQILEIMQDSHVGAMGVLALVSVLLLKFAALLSVPSLQLWKTVLLMPLAGRCAMVLHLALLPYVRAQGLGSVFTQTRPWIAAIEAVLLLSAAGWLLLGFSGLAAAGASLLAALLLAAYIHRKIGGATGDTYGAVCELVELIPALTLAVWPTAA
jgi:adenosylcobinamide-GDP ribazoletransferase